MNAPDFVLTTKPAPCVYAWYRDGRCLYVGSTVFPVFARLREHKVVDFRLGDELHLWSASIDQLPALEQQAITELKPVYNQLPAGRTFRRRKL